MIQTVRITRIEGFAFRSPVAKPVMTSFGMMRDRPAAFLRIEDEDGAFGWGEIFANWPAAAAEHRINLLAGLSRCKAVNGVRFVRSLPVSTLRFGTFIRANPAARCGTS